jgi:glycerol kinase
MQLQADICAVPVIRPVVAETTAPGAAYAAGLACGFWQDTDEPRTNWHESRRREPTWTPDRRETGYAGWQKAVTPHPQLERLKASLSQRHWRPSPNAIAFRC